MMLTPRYGLLAEQVFTYSMSLKKTHVFLKLSAWKNITSLPHALECTHAIESSIIQDTTTSSHRASSTLSLRQSYATAIIRLVNGLVDPLQLGAYARSISSIASQLGLPPWLVELRHAATHEDLPSLEVLREAARSVRLLSPFPETSSVKFNRSLSPGYDLASQQLFSPHVVSYNTASRSHSSTEIASACSQRV